MFLIVNPLLVLTLQDEGLEAQRGLEIAHGCTVKVEARLEPGSLIPLPAHV